MGDNSTSEYVPKSDFVDEADFYNTSATSIIMTVMSAVSAIGSLTILYTFAHILKGKHRRGLMQIIIFIAASNLMTSLGSILGFPADRSFACWWEGLVTNIFTLSSVYWCLDVTVILYFIVVLGKARTIGVIDHLICWLVPVFATVLPFINFTYGAPDGLGWCFVVPHDDLVDSKNISMLWFWVAYYFHIWFCVFCMIVMFVQIWHKIKSHANITQNMLMKIYKKLQHYPVVIVICWLPACIVDTTNLALGTYEGYDTVNSVSSFLACSQGLFTSIIFWSTYEEAYTHVKQTIKASRASFMGERYEPGSATEHSESRGSVSYNMSVDSDGSESNLRSKSERRAHTVVEYRSAPLGADNSAGLLGWIRRMSSPEGLVTKQRPQPSMGSPAKVLPVAEAEGIEKDFDDTEKGNLVPIETTTVSNTTTHSVITE